MPLYKRAPITEAAIELRYEQELQKEAIDKLQSRFKADYQISEPFSFVDVKLEVAARQAKFREVAAGHKSASSDRVDVLLIQLQGMVCSRLAPYLGWDSFRDRAQRDWRKWKNTVGYRKLARIGVRYINRIDIPVGGPGERIRLENYVKVYPMYPEEDIPGLSNYTMQMQGDLGADECRIIINSGLVPSPLVRHASILLDIDVTRDRAVPQTEDEIWELVEKIRGHKNRVFESSVTDRARELFDT